MKNKWMLIYLLISFFGFSSCEEEEVKPSFADEERLEKLLDLSKPLVKEYKEKYNVNILYDFHDTLDFKFGFYTLNPNQSWSKIDVTHLDSVEVVDYALEKLDEMVFAYLKENFKKRLPYKMLLADIIELGNTTPDNLISEPDSPESGTVTAIGNPYSYMFAFNKESIESFSEAKIKTLRDVKLYHLISYVINKDNLYSEIPDAFYAPVNGLHGESVDSLAAAEEVLPVGTGPYAKYYTPDWYMSLGMALTVNSPKKSASTNYQMRLSINSSLKFPDNQRDFRNFLYVMIFSKKTDLEKYYLPSEVFSERMRIAMETLEDWGIDVLKINPALEMFYE